MGTAPNDNNCLDLLHTEAAQIAYDQMLQEDLAQALKRHLCWYACHLHWSHPPPPVEETPDESAKEEEEEVQVDANNSFSLFKNE